MGDFFKTIVVKTISESDAQQSSFIVRDWLIKKEIIVGAMSDCVLDNDGLGYAPGKQFWQVLSRPNQPLLDSTHESKNYLQIYNLKTNGMSINIGRQVFLGWLMFGHFKLNCEQCGFIEQYDWPAGLEDAVTNWYQKVSETDFSCPQCQIIKPIHQLDFVDSLALANLGFTFWNWPQLKDSIVAEIGDLLNYETTLISGKL